MKLSPLLKPILATQLLRLLQDLKLLPYLLRQMAIPQ
jgi:hypothetical protein